MQTCTMIVCCLLAVITVQAAAAASDLTVTEDDVGEIISINCGSTASSSSPGLGGRQWFGDVRGRLKGSSAHAVAKSVPSVLFPVVPYATARASRSRFSYSFKLNPGQKFIRLHFNPASSYDGFQNFDDLFDVEAGPFTLLSNFSASITADALAVLVLVKEFCITVQENQPLDIIFTPATGTYSSSYAFVNGIEIISLPASLSYCLGGDTGVRVVGQNSVVYIDNATALEMVHRLSVKRNSVLPVDDFPGMVGMWRSERVVGKKGKNGDNSVSWKVSVDTGFRYLVRVHFCELGLRLGRTDFKLLIDHVIVNTRDDVVEETDVNGILWFRNHMVEMKGRKEKGKRDILISLHSENEVVDRHGAVERFEIFKLSNHDDSLASPNPSPPAKDSPLHPIKSVLVILGQRNAFATVVITALCLINIVIHLLQQCWEDNSTEEENKPSNRAKRICRLFSFSEIQSATKDFHDAFIIGRGGFGIVYKGIIDDGQEIVAIKRLKLHSRQGEREFWTEIEMLSELRHNNVVSLFGYCNEQKEMILVYEYMSGGTLADHLHKMTQRDGNISSLSWVQRLKICIGAGRGLDYLHTGHRVIHRDVKPSNVLLDENFVAKVSDFGLARIDKEDSTKLKGTTGYIDPDYCRTNKLTLKSDTYSFGVVLLEVLCGRKAIDPSLGEDKKNLTMWAQKSISEGDVDQIVAPSLRGDISPDSLKTFLGVATKCLHDEPQQRPTIAYVVINLEFALEQQEDAKALVPNERKSIADFFPHRQFTVGSSTSQNVTSVLKGQTHSAMVNAERPQRQKNRRKSALHKLSRLWPRDAFWSSRKLSENRDSDDISISAPVARKLRERSSTVSKIAMCDVEETDGSIPDFLPAPNLRIFSFSELKAATRNFRPYFFLGEGGFGSVFKGFLNDKVAAEVGSRPVVAIKALSPDSNQGLEEWQSEVTFLGRLSHPNLVKLLGYCSQENHLSIVYEFMQKGSLEKHLFGSTSVPLPWNTRVKILTGAARGLAFLHGLDVPIIYRDFKTSNILLDESYNAKLSDFGLAKMGPVADHSHVSTRVAGTVGYLDPEYFLTGHVNAKSDVYGFGMVLLEVFTGLRAIDVKRPSGERHLIDIIKPCVSEMSKLLSVMDPHLGRYPIVSALQIVQLALNCLENVSIRRPSMREVVETLENIDLDNEKPIRFSEQVANP